MSISSCSNANKKNIWTDERNVAVNIPVNTSLYEIENISVGDNSNMLQETYVGHDSLNEILCDVGNDDVFLRRNSYLLSYNLATKCPNYVSWKIDSYRLSKNVERSDWFEEDADIKSEYRIKHSDYSRSGFDRGHMCPAADNRYDSVAMRECFLMTNMCPQTHTLNSGDWNDLEDLCRKWTDNGLEVYVVCGPVYADSNEKFIGKRKSCKIRVPDSFFKVVLLKDNSEWCAMGFLMNNNTELRDLSDYLISVDEVEALTGFDFFHMLPDDVENRVEKMDNLYHNY